MVVLPTECHDSSARTQLSQLGIISLNWISSLKDNTPLLLHNRVNPILGAS